MAAQGLAKGAVMHDAHRWLDRFVGLHGVLATIIVTIQTRDDDAKAQQIAFLELQFVAL